MAGTSAPFSTGVVEVRAIPRVVAMMNIRRNVSMIALSLIMPSKNLFVRVYIKLFMIGEPFI
jgi:hypothetical protein